MFQTGYFTVLIIVVLGYYCRKYMKKLWFFTSTLCISFLAFVVYLPLVVLQRNSLLWVLELLNDRISVSTIFFFFFLNKVNLYSCANLFQMRLIVFWITCCCFSIYCLWKQAALNAPASSASRKNFHFAVLFVLVPGLVFRPCLMYLASGVGFAILVTVEVSLCSYVKYLLADVSHYSILIKIIDYSQIAIGQTLNDITIVFRYIQRFQR